MVDRLVNSEINAKRIQNVENCFGITGVPLGVPGRVLVGEGVLTKICRKRPKSRQFFLFNDILVYGSILINKKRYTHQHIIPLEGLVVEDLLDEIVMKNGWLIKTSCKSFAVYAASPSEKSEWIRHIKKCTNDLLEQTGRTAPSNELTAAVWIPDSIARICMACKKTQFTMINRRHHCRKCGNVICSNCSKNRVVIQSQSNYPVRVCDKCHENFYNHLNKTKKISIPNTLQNQMLSTSTVSTKKPAQKLIDDAAEIKLCIGDAIKENRIEEWVSIASEQYTEHLRQAENELNENNSSESNNESFKEIKLTDEKMDNKIDLELDAAFRKSDEYIATSDSEEDEQNLSSSIEDILEQQHEQPTFYDLQLSKDGEISPEIRNESKDVEQIKTHETESKILEKNLTNGNEQVNEELNAKVQEEQEKINEEKDHKIESKQPLNENFLNEALNDLNQTEEINLKDKKELNEKDVDKKDSENKMNVAKNFDDDNVKFKEKLV